MTGWKQNIWIKKDANSITNPDCQNYNKDRGDMNQKHVTTWALPIVIVSFLTSTCVSLWSLHTMSLRNQEELSKILTAQIYDVIASELSDAITVSRTMASDVFVADTLKHEAEEGAAATLKNYLSGIQSNLNHEAAFIVSDASGKYYTVDGVTKVIDPQTNSYDRWYTAFLESGEEYDLDVDNDELAQGEWTVFVNCRMKDDQGSLLGVCGVGVRMALAKQKLEQLEKTYHVSICLIDEKRLVQIDLDENNIEKLYLEGLSLPSPGSQEYLYQRLGKDQIAVTKYIDSLDWYLVVESDGSQERGQFVNVIFLNVAVFLVLGGLLALAMHTIAKRTRTLADASLKDSSTGLLNRRAFEEEKERRSRKAPEADFVYMIADLNGLKTANDTMGHEAGDELIKGAADLLKLYFGPYGRVYRIGGDEFAAIMRISEAQLEEVQENFDMAMQTWEGTLNKELSISCGYASAKEYPSESFAGLSHIADERMYAAKEHYYLTSGKDRRRQ